MNHTSAQYVRQYLTWQRDSRGRKPVTIMQYASILASWLDWIEPLDLSQATTQQVEAWLQRPREGRAKGCVGAAATQAKNLTALRSLYSYLRSRNLIEHDPTRLAGAPAVRNRQPKAIPDKVWLRLLDSPHVDLVDRVALGLGFYVGLRRREVCELATHHVLEGRLVGFERKGGVDDITPYRDMLAALDDRLPHLRAGEWEAALLELVDLRNGEFVSSGRPENTSMSYRKPASEARDAPYLIPWGESRGHDPWVRVAHDLSPGMTAPDSFNRRLNRLCHLSNVTHVTPHALRHSACTNLLRAGVPLHIVSSLMNHSSLSVTTRYIKAGGAELREWLSATAQGV